MQHQLHCGEGRHSPDHLEGLAIGAGYSECFVTIFGRACNKWAILQDDVKTIIINRHLNI